MLYMDVFLYLYRCNILYHKSSRRQRAVLHAPTKSAFTPTEAPKTTSISGVSGNKCFKCGTSKKSGKRSCCSPGGDWFKNCGDEGDTNVDHMWTEGVQTCKRHEVTQTRSNDAREGNGPQQNIIDSTSGIMSATGSANCEELCLLSKIIIFITFLCIILNM